VDENIEKLESFIARLYHIQQESLGWTVGMKEKS
jgi:hypothetical protein